MTTPVSGPNRLKKQICFWFLTYWVRIWSSVTVYYSLLLSLPQKAIKEGQAECCQVVQELLALRLCARAEEDATAWSYPVTLS